MARYFSFNFKLLFAKNNNNNATGAVATVLRTHAIIVIAFIIIIDDDWQGNRLGNCAHKAVMAFNYISQFVDVKATVSTLL